MGDHRDRVISTSRWIMMLGGLAGASAVGAQSVVVRTRPPVPVRPPTLVLAYPDARSASARREDDALVFRFGAGDPADPIDFGSFRVLVDGADRTEGFRITASEAWGAIDTNEGPVAANARPLHIEARICSVRGVCTTILGSVAAVQRDASGVDVSRRDGSSRRRRWLATFSEMLRRLLALPPGPPG